MRRADLPDVIPQLDRPRVAAREGLDEMTMLAAGRPSSVSRIPSAPRATAPAMPLKHAIKHMACLVPFRMTSILPFSRIPLT